MVQKVSQSIKSFFPTLILLSFEAAAVVAAVAAATDSSCEDSSLAASKCFLGLSQKRRAEKKPLGLYSGLTPTSIYFFQCHIGTRGLKLVGLLWLIRVMHAAKVAASQF